MNFSKMHVLVLLSLILVLFLGTRLYLNKDTYLKQFEKQLGSQRQSLQAYGRSEDIYFNTAKLIQERNNMSRELNYKQQKLGQLECEKAKGKEKIASSGGWCSQSSTESGGQHKTDRKLVPVLAEVLKGKTVASFGDGPGRYKQLLLASGLLNGYDAYDGAPFSEKTSDGRVMFLDLTLPQFGLPLYDWVISLEVAEHIPKQYESIYIDNIVRHAKEGVILSWAVPGQAGYSHVNNQPFKYVNELFHTLGFEHDAENSTKLKKASSLEWLQANTNVYRRKDMSNIEHLRTFFT